MGFPPTSPVIIRATLKAHPLSIKISMHNVITIIFLIFSLLTLSQKFLYPLNYNTPHWKLKEANLTEHLFLKRNTSRVYVFPLEIIVSLCYNLEQSFFLKEHRMVQRLLE